MTRIEVLENRKRKLSKIALTWRLTDSERLKALRLAIKADLLIKAEKLKTMDWINIDLLPDSGEFYFLVNGEIKRGFVGDWPSAVKFTTLEVIF